MVMPEQSSMHLYLNWTKERIDELDAALASLEVKASQGGLQGDGGRDHRRSEEAPRRVSGAA
jgi:hypothetical protein